MNKSHRRATFPMGTNKPINITIMETFTFRYAMSIDINASSEEEARAIFETMPFDKIFEKGDFVELEDVYKSR